MARLSALLLAILLLLPRAALGAVVLHCGGMQTAEKCCCCHKKPKPASEPLLKRAPCCDVQSPAHAPSTPATTHASELKLPALALAGEESHLPVLSSPELSNAPQAALARGPPARKVPLFLSHCTLLR